LLIPRPGGIQAQPAVDDKGERAKGALRWDQSAIRRKD
jgi:hypothetical protein